MRLLGDGEAARDAEHEALASGHADPVDALAAAAVACRARIAGNGAEHAPPATQPGEDDGLAHAVARELRAATTRLPERQREALALRDMLELGYGDVGRVVGIAPSAVALLLARARLRLRAELRAEEDAAGSCPERERALRTIALRQDGQPVPEADDDWLMDHLGHCAECGRAHAAMLEASACYRAWR